MHIAVLIYLIASHIDGMDEYKSNNGYVVKSIYYGDNIHVVIIEIINDGYLILFINS